MREVGASLDVQLLAEEGGEYATGHPYSFKEVHYARIWSCSEPPGENHVGLSFVCFYLHRGYCGVSINAKRTAAGFPIPFPKIGDKPYSNIVPTMLFIPSSVQGWESLEQKVFQGHWDRSVVDNGSNNPFQTLSGVFCYGAHFIRIDLAQH